MIKAEEITILKKQTTKDEFFNTIYKEIQEVVPITVTSEKYTHLDISDSSSYEKTIGFKVERELMAPLFKYNGKQYKVIASNEIDLVNDYVTALELTNYKEVKNES